MTRNPKTDIGFAPSKELRDLSASVRRLMEMICATDGFPDELTEARKAIDAISGRLERIAPTGTHFRFHPEHDVPEGSRPYMAGNPRDWDYNPINPPIEVELRGNVLHGRTTLGLPYEGPPNMVHGGMVAHLFDQMLGYANTANGIPGFTATLTIRYLKPTPLFTELRIEAQPVRNEGRKIFSQAKLYAGETLTAEAEGLFLRPEIPPEYVPPGVHPIPSKTRNLKRSGSPAEGDRE